jgi:hypothetical protein
MISDRDRISTRQLNRLRRRILRVYGTARREMQEQLTEFLAKYKQLDERKREQLDVGEITEEDYRIWLQNQVFQSDLMHAKLDGITQTCATAQQTAYKLARDEQYNIFSFGANWTFYELEQAAGVTFGLTLYNTEAVRLLLQERPRLVPNKRIKSESNRTYDARVFNRYVMQGIVQGKSVHDIAVQAVNGMADTEIHWAMNNAITALTSAQNAGALQQMRNAQALGIEVKKRWNSTHDYRTREMHRLLDQQTAELGKQELKDNAYVTDCKAAVAPLGRGCCHLDVWEINRRIAGGDTSHWEDIAAQIEAEIEAHNDNFRKSQEEQPEKILCFPALTA